MDLLALKRSLHSFRGLRNEDGDGEAGGSMSASPTWSGPSNTEANPGSTTPPADRTWSDALGSVTTSPGGGISWSGSGGSGSYTNPGPSYSSSFLSNLANYTSPVAGSFGQGSYKASTSPQFTNELSMSKLGDYAKTNGYNLSSVLGREPTPKELAELSSMGYGGMYGANPNNLTGQTVEQMLATSDLGRSLQGFIEGIPGVRTIQSLPDLFRNPSTETFTKTAASLPGVFGIPGQFAQQMQNYNKGAPTDFSRLATSALGPWGGVATNALQGNMPAAGAQAGSTLGGTLGSMFGGQATRSLGGAMVGGLAGSSFGRGLGSMFGRSLSDFGKK